MIRIDTYREDNRHRLNAVCPYFTMFPLAFPKKILSKANSNAVVLDPFCGRGTSNYAARDRGLTSYGIDSSPVAVAIAKAKMVNTTFDDVMHLTWSILINKRATSIPSGEFWKRAYHEDTLNELVRLRHGLLECDQSDAAVMLRAIVLGCLHGPLPKNLENAGYFSNQMPRTYATKPAYSIKYWKLNHLNAPRIPVVVPIQKKAAAIFASIMKKSPTPPSSIICADSRTTTAFKHIDNRVSHVITSPPYYGLRTYVADQWLRNWFLGGETKVRYKNNNQISHASPQEFAASLSDVWNNCGDVLKRNGRLIIRFGSIKSRHIDPREVINESISISRHSWHLYRTVPLDPARPEKRQAHHMGTGGKALKEYDFYIKSN